LQLKVKVSNEHRVQVGERDHPLVELLINGVHQMLVRAVLLSRQSLLDPNIQRIVTSLRELRPVRANDSHISRSHLKHIAL
jgi:hypothetical protein